MELMERDYNPNSKKITQLVVSGFVASLVVLVVGAVASLIGYHPNVDELYGSLVNGGVEPQKFAMNWWGGVAVYLIGASAIFPLLFDYLTERNILTSRRMVRGVLAGTAVWIVAELILKPLAGYGTFSSFTEFPTLNVVLTFGLACSYGLLLEGMMRVPVVHAMRWERRAA